MSADTNPADIPADTPLPVMIFRRVTKRQSSGVVSYYVGTSTSGGRVHADLQTPLQRARKRRRAQ